MHHLRSAAAGGRVGSQRDVGGSVEVSAGAGLREVDVLRGRRGIQPDEREVEAHVAAGDGGLVNLDGDDVRAGDER